MNNMPKHKNLTGSKLKYLRVRKGLKAVDVARISRVSPSQISLIEREIVILTQDMGDRLLKAINEAHQTPNTSV